MHRLIKSKESIAFNSEEDIENRRKEYFKSVLNQPKPDNDSNIDHHINTIEKILKGPITTEETRTQ